MAVTLTLRESLYAEAATLTSERDDLPPTSVGYAQKSLDLDEVLSAIFALGPVDV